MPPRFALAVLLPALAVSPVAAQEFAFPFHGGSGGTEVTVTCPDDAVLVAISGRGGWWLDQIGASCVRVTSTGNWHGGLLTRGPAGGSGGNALPTMLCPPGTAINSISGRHGSYVHSLRLGCFDMGTGASVSGAALATLSFGVGGGDQAWAFESCPGAKPAKGFRVRVGSYVHAFRFICHSGTGFPRTLAPPTSAPVLFSPPDLTTLTSTNLRPSFQWQFVQGARRYTLCVRRPSSTTCDVLSAVVQQGFSGINPIPVVSFRPASDLQFGTVAQLHWTVVGCNDVGCGPWAVLRRLNAPPPPAPPPPAAPVATFATLAPTFRHARCQNCHAGTATNFAAGSIPGLPAGHTAVTATNNSSGTCQNCHTNTLLPGSGTVNPGWHSPPTTMDFRNRTDQQLCDQVKTLGSSTAVSLHLKEDKLVLWAVGDGRRPSNTTPYPLAPPGSITSWRTLVDTWVNGGMVCN